MRYNGTFKFQPVTSAVQDPATGLYSAGSETAFTQAQECQIDKNTPARQMIGADGQEHTYSYNVYVPNDAVVTGLAIGSVVRLFDTDGQQIDEFHVLGIDDLNPKYVEIWG